MATDPWQPFGTLIYHIVMFIAKATGYQPLTGGTQVKPIYSEEQEPRWTLCLSCNHETVHEAHFWIEEGDTDWECTRCGMVTYG